MRLLLRGRKVTHPALDGIEARIHAVEAAVNVFELLGDTAGGDLGVRDQDIEAVLGFGGDGAVDLAGHVDDSGSAHGTFGLELAVRVVDSLFFSAGSVGVVGRLLGGKDGRWEELLGFFAFSVEVYGPRCCVQQDWSLHVCIVDAPMVFESVVHCLERSTRMVVGQWG